MEKIKVFVSSVMKDGELEPEREIACQVLKQMNINPRLFELFPSMNHSPWEAYIDEVSECDVFLMILWKTLTPAVKNEYNEAIRRNKPILLLVKSLVDLEERKPELKDFMDKLHSCAPENAIRHTVYRRFRKLSELEESIRESISAEISKFYSKPFYALSREECYQLGTSIVLHAQSRLCIFQKTPSLLLGARPYLADDFNKYDYEKVMLDAIEQWISINNSIHGKELVYLFSLDAMKKELLNERDNLINSQPFMKMLYDKIEFYIELEKKTQYRFRIRPVDKDKDASGPLIVGDNRYAMTLLDKDTAISISHENGNISDFLVRMLRVHGQRTLEEYQLMNFLTSSVSEP